MDKISSRAWKRNFSESIRKALEDSGTLNHEKELAGLIKGTDNIVKKHNIVRLKPGLVNIAKALKDSDSTKIQKIKIAVNHVADKYFGSGGHLAISGKGKDYIFTGKGLTPPLKRIYKQYSDIKHPGKKSLSGKYVKGLLDRHEADEIRSMQKLKSKNKPRSLQYFSHASPEVIFRESANVAASPTDAKRVFTDDLRKINLNKKLSTAEKRSLLDYHNFNYGEKPVFDKIKSKELSKNFEHLNILNQYARVSPGKYRGIHTSKDASFSDEAYNMDKVAYYKDQIEKMAQLK